MTEAAAPRVGGAARSDAGPDGVPVRLVVGRFQPLHHGHVALIHAALDAAPAGRVVVAVGSSQTYGTPTNPYSFSERRAMIRAVFPDEHRVAVLPVPDINDPPNWVAHTVAITGPVAAVYGNDDATLDLFATAGHAVVRPGLLQRDSYQASVIRAQLGTGDPGWRSAVPDVVHAIIHPSTGLAAVAVAALRARGATLAVAESCTGGGLGAAVVAVPGASAAFRGGIIAYHNDVKTGLLGVPAGTMAAGGPGAVSRDCASAMATGARDALRADVAVAITGIAGPDGATADKPLGTVWLAVADDAGAEARCHQFTGDRKAVQAAAVDAAVALLLDRLRQVP